MNCLISVISPPLGWETKSAVLRLCYVGHKRLLLFPRGRHHALAATHSVFFGLAELRKNTFGCRVRPAFGPGRRRRTSASIAARACAGFELSFACVCIILFVRPGPAICSMLDLSKYGVLIIEIVPMKNKLLSGSRQNTKYCT